MEKKPGKVKTVMHEFKAGKLHSGTSGKIVKRTGARNWRNNNPGNLNYGDFAKKNKAIGTDGRFAVFPTYADGRKAKESLLFEGSGYKNLDISRAIARYAPPSENNTTNYINTVSKAAGVPSSTPLASLNATQRQAMLASMEKVEGFKVGKEEVLKASKGGLFTGARTGYPVELHGTEMIIPMDQNSILKTLATKSDISAAATIDSIEHILESTDNTGSLSNTSAAHAEQIVKIDNDMRELLLHKLNRMLTVLDSRHGVTKKILRHATV